jgi:hypothetical protein
MVRTTFGLFPIGEAMAEPLGRALLWISFLSPSVRHWPNPWDGCVGETLAEPSCRAFADSIGSHLGETGRLVTGAAFQHTR